MHLAKYLFLAAYVGSILISNLLIDKFIPLPGFGLLSMGTIFFAFVFTLRDHLHRFGLKFARFGIVLALLVNTFFGIIFAIPVRFIMASFLAIMLSELADTAVVERLKRRSWPVKVLASNAVSVPVDSILMTMIAFFGVMSAREMGEIIFADILAKYLIAMSVIIRPETIKGIVQIIGRKRLFRSL